MEINPNSEKMKLIIVLAAILGVSLAAPSAHSLQRKIAPRTLADDFQDFIDLLDVDAIQTLIQDHLDSDGAFVAVVLYLQGPEWNALVDSVLAIPAVQDFIDYLNNAGVPVDDILGAITDAINNAVPGTDPDAEGSLRPFLDELEAILPIDDLVALLFDKLQNSPDFQDFYTEISSEEARQLVEEVRAIPEVQRLGQRLRELGVDVDGALQIIYAFLGWGLPSPVSTPSTTEGTTTTEGPTGSTTEGTESTSEGSTEAPESTSEGSTEAPESTSEGSTEAPDSTTEGSTSSETEGTTASPTEGSSEAPTDSSSAATETTEVTETSDATQTTA